MHERQSMKNPHSGVPLTGWNVRIESFAEEHRQPLQDAGADPAIWTYLSVDASTPDVFNKWFDWSLKLQQSGKEWIFVVRDCAANRIVGSTRYLNIEPHHARLEIGHTWYAPSVWGKSVNPACKLLLIRHAFDDWNANRVELRCDARNDRSRRAIARLGAREEGILRKHMVVRDGFVRDTVQFGITREDRPKIEAGLLERLGTDS